MRTNPNLPQARFGFGVALGNLGEYEKALREFDQVIRDEPGNVKAHNARGLALLHLNRLPEAVEAFQRAIELDTNYADSHYNIACTYSRLNRFGECLDHLIRVKRLDGFTGMDPLLDPDLAGIRSNPDYNSKFRALIPGSGNYVTS